MRDAAAEFDNFEPALDVALAVRDHLAVLATQHMRQRVHIGLDQPFELEHHPRTPLRVGHCPCRLRGQRGIDCTLQNRSIAQANPRLHSAAVRVEHIAETNCRGYPRRRELNDLFGAYSLS